MEVVHSSLSSIWNFDFIYRLKSFTSTLYSSMQNGDQTLIVQRYKV